MSDEDFDDMGPVDYLLVEWPGRQPQGEAAPALIDLVERGIIRVLDLTFLVKGEDGEVGGLEIADHEGLEPFMGAATGLVSEEDIAEAAEALEPGTSAALLVYENLWAAPFAKAVRKSGGQLVANGRIPVQALLAALEQFDDDEPAQASS